MLVSVDRGLEFKAIYLCLVLTGGRYARRNHDGGLIMADKFICDLLDRGTSYISRSVSDFQRNFLLHLDTSAEGEDIRISEFVVTCCSTMK